MSKMQTRGQVVCNVWRSTLPGPPGTQPRPSTCKRGSERVSSSSLEHYQRATYTRMGACTTDNRERHHQS